MSHSTSPATLMAANPSSKQDGPAFMELAKAARQYRAEVSEALMTIIDFNCKPIPHCLRKTSVELTTIVARLIYYRGSKPGQYLAEMSDGRKALTNVEARPNGMAMAILRYVALLFSLRRSDLRLFAD